MNPDETVPPYIIPVEGQKADPVTVYHLHTPFNPGSQDDVGIQGQTSTPVYTVGGGEVGTGLGSGKQKYVSYDSDLGRTPGMTTCTSCQTQVMTNVSYKPGTYAWLMCLLFICCGLILCCCLIPLLLKNFKDAYHTCPRCQRILYVDKKRCCS